MTGSWLHRLFGSPADKISPSHDVGPASTEEVPSSVSRERIERYLDQHDYNYGLDDDGDLTGHWDGNQIWLILMGEDDEILQVRGRWHDTLNVSDRLNALRAINDWNRDRIWPKVYLREEKPGLALYAEVSVDLEHGVTDAQLHQYLECAIATSVLALNAAPTMFVHPSG